MKVAILTFHNSPNNAGAVLQAWALQREVEKLGHEAVIIDYRRERGDRDKWWGFGSLHGIYYTVKRFPNELMRKMRCDAFRRRHLNLTPAQYGDCVSYRNADAYIVGSDQVFNPLHNEMNSAFLLDFVPHGKKRIAYGASLGTDAFPDEYMQMLEKSLPRFNALSVREDSGAETVKRIADVDAQVVLDPTLLHNAEEYWPLMEEERSASLPFEPYVFMYIIGRHHDARRIALEKACEIGAKRIVVMTNGRAEWHLPQFGIFRRIHVYSPSDFLAYITSAAYVVTNSFHGTAFSIIFNRPFTSLRNGTSGDSRMTTLLKAANGGGLDPARHKSIAFLKEALS
ncbi:MAG: polysaccharide pyruvyl transferase family protein [Kiritimatiellia bacterium]